MIDQIDANGDSVEIISGKDIVPEPIRWIWQNWLALGKVHFIAGAPGTGKTTIVMSIAATLTVGGRWPDGSQAPVGDVLVWSGEDDIRDTLLPRFLAAGGNSERIHFVDGVISGNGKRAFDPAIDMTMLATKARSIKDLRMLIIDPISSAVSGDSHKNSEVRRGLQPISDVAKELDIAVQGVTHFTKRTARAAPLDRVLGSVAFGAVPRVVMGTVTPANPEAPSRLVRVKSNNGPTGDGFEYRCDALSLPGGIIANRVQWGEPLVGSASELMNVDQVVSRRERRQGAAALLTELLRGGKQLSKVIERVVLEAGHTKRTINRAKKELGIKAIKIGSQWWLELPMEDKVPQDGHLPPEWPPSA